jgi:rubredoxin
MSDLIERSAVLDLMRTNWADNDGDTAMQLSIDDVRSLPAATAYKMSAVDAIKRESVLNTLDTMNKALDEDRTVESYKELLAECYKALPRATPKPRAGHWVEIGDEPYDTWECDNCGFVIDGSGCVDPEEYRDIYKYCPNCGAKMEGESE